MWGKTYHVDDLKWTIAFLFIIFMIMISIAQKWKLRQFFSLAFPFSIKNTFIRIVNSLCVCRTFSSYPSKFMSTFKIGLLKHSTVVFFSEEESTKEYTKRELYLLCPFLMIDRLSIPTSIKLNWEIVLKYKYLTIKNITRLQSISSIQFS